MGSRVVKRAFKYRFYPSEQQAAELSRTFGCVRARYPTFKSRKRSRAAAAYTRSAFRWRDGELTLAKMSEPLDIAWSRPLPDHAEPSTVTVSRDCAGRWYVSILVETPVSDGPATESTVGVDLGITSLVILSTGEKVANPRHEERDRARLARAQRNLDRKQKGSANRAKARLRVARVHARIADRRRDHLHKLTSRLVAENQRIVIEDLSVRNMVRNHSLARAISDAAWRELRGMLEYKCAWYGRELVAIDRWFPSSKVCSACGALQDCLPLNVREWTCRCGTRHDRDVNAAKNIRAAGLAVLACGDGVRPARAQAPVGDCR
jgi:putative transposase